MARAQTHALQLALLSAATGGCQPARSEVPRPASAAAPSSRITRSPGLPIRIGGIHRGVAGGGYRGATADLDAMVDLGAALLAEAYGRDVTIRFNSDRRSGGAWVVTHAQDGFGANAELGICAAFIEITPERAALWAARGVPYLRPVGSHLVWVAHIGTASLVSADVATACTDDPERRYAHVEVPDADAALAFLRTNGTLRARYS